MGVLGGLRLRVLHLGIQSFASLSPIQKTIIVNPRKLEHGFRRISARIPYTLP